MLANRKDSGIQFLSLVGGKSFKQGPADLRAERGQVAEVARKDAVDGGFISWHLVLVAFLSFLGRLFHLSLGFVSL